MLSTNLSKTEVMAAEVVALFSKFIRTAVLVPELVFLRVKGIPGVLEAKVTVIVVVAKEMEEEAWRLPRIWRGADTVEEAEEINPPVKLDKPVTPRVEATVKVEEALIPPATWRLPVMVDDPTEIKAPFKLARLATLKVDEALTGPETLSWAVTVEEPLEINPDKLANPPTFKVEDADRAPLTCKRPATEEEAAPEINPPVKVERLVTDKVSAKVAAPPTFKVEEERNTPETWRLPATVEEAEEIKPDKLERPVTPKVEATVRVEEAFRPPATWRLPATVEEA